MAKWFDSFYSLILFMVLTLHLSTRYRFYSILSRNLITQSMDIKIKFCLDMRWLSEKKAQPKSLNVKPKKKLRLIW